MVNNTVQNIRQKANFLNRLSNSEEYLFEYINTNKENLNEVIKQYQPEREFKPVNTLRFLIANEIKKGTIINKELVEQLKQAIENRDVSAYFNLNDTLKQSLVNYKQSKTGMFPNWKHTFKIFFPFIHSAVENNEVKELLNQLANDIIEISELENVTKHIVSFQGSQNYGSDRIWVAIIPESSPSVQYAYQIFFTIDTTGLIGGIHKGHNLKNKEFENQNLIFNEWNDYIEHSKQVKDQWSELNSEVNFIFLNDEKEFVKTLKKMEIPSLSNYFHVLDRFKTDSDIQDEEKLVFSLAKGRLSFQVGKRYCFNLNKTSFDFISNNELELGDTNRETFSGTDNTYLYKDRTIEDVFDYYEDIKFAIENEIERDNHALAKSYDNSAFRKAVFDQQYRGKFIQNIEKPNSSKKYWALGFNSNEGRLNLFKNEGYWQAMDYPKNDSRPAAKRARKLFDQIQIGDYVVIKGYGGSHDLVIHFKAEVEAKDYESERLELKKIVGYLYKGKAPRGSGAGNWHETILQVKRESDIKLLFGENMENMEIRFKEFLKLSVATGTVKTYLSAIRSIETLAKKRGLMLSSIYNFDKLNDFQSFWERLKAVELYTETNNKHHNRYNSALLKYEEFLTSMANNLKPNNIYKASLNQIFYGPPGTGKTYNTILESAKIITQNDGISYDDAQYVFNEQLGNRLEFITFHQNYSYEDFIQGLRPDVDQKVLSFDRTDGVFTKIATNAMFEFYRVYQHRQKQAANNTDVKIDLNDAYIEFVGSLNEEQEFETKTGKRVKITNFTDKQNIEFKPIEGVKSYLVSSTRLLKLYKKFPNIEDIMRVHEDIRDAIGGCNSTIYYVALREFIVFLENYKTTVNDFEDADNDEYEDITYKRKKELLANFDLNELREIETAQVPSYVIIIDEINRANISRVFGELITLIEKDKRSHGKIPIRATLPSGEKFMVPSNLYIIGTMNTADKSIALLDIALRRRFEFVPMYPNSESSGDKVVIDPIILDTINKEIISRKGYDFTIGHSYFMGEDYDLENTINNKVIPLLLEYFMNDHEEVKNILNAAGLDVAGWPMKLVSND